MSAIDLRDMFLATIDLNLHGDGDKVGGAIAGIAAGHCKTFEDYRDQCGYIRGLNTAREMMQRCFQQLFNPQPEEGDPNA